jgi:hypothetical protein
MYLCKVDVCLSKGASTLIIFFTVNLQNMIVSEDLELLKDDNSILNIFKLAVKAKKRRPDLLWKLVLA